LAKQIEQGAPADIFASADTDWMDYSIGKKNINEPTRVNLLGNAIVLIAPKDSKIDNVASGSGFDLQNSLATARSHGRCEVVPVGKYAKASLENSARGRGGAEIRMTENVRAALALVARGEAVLESYIRPTPSRARRENSRHFPGGFASSDHLSGGRDRYRESGTATSRLLRSSSAKAIFEKYGFQVLVSRRPERVRHLTN